MFNKYQLFISAFVSRSQDETAIEISSIDQCHMVGSKVFPTLQMFSSTRKSWGKLVPSAVHPPISPSEPDNQC